MILNGDFMILNDGVYIEKNEEQKQTKIPIYSFSDMVDLKCEKIEKCGQNIFFRLISMKIFLGTIQTILSIFFSKVKKKNFDDKNVKIFC